MATALKKPSREKEEAREGDMSLSPHPLCVHTLPSRKPNRENRIKNACLSNSHSNIALSNDKRPLFVQIPATSSASLVSTSLPIQCLRPTNFFFFRGIFADNFLRNLFRPPPQRILIGSEPTIPLKSRSPDVGASGLIVRRKGVDMLPIASSVKGRKVRIRARVQLPNHYPVWW